MPPQNPADGPTHDEHVRFLAPVRGDLRATIAVQVAQRHHSHPEQIVEVIGARDQGQLLACASAPDAHLPIEAPRSVVGYAGGKVRNPVPVEIASP